MLSPLFIAALVTCWEKVDLLALVCDVYCIFVTFPCGILGQVWYQIISFTDLCRLIYLEKSNRYQSSQIIQRKNRKLIMQN